MYFVCIWCVVYCMYMRRILYVYGTICTDTRICTYFLYGKLLGASIRAYPYNIRVYVQYTDNILHHIHSNTLEYTCICFRNLRAHVQHQDLVRSSNSTGGITSAMRRWHSCRKGAHARYLLLCWILCDFQFISFAAGILHWIAYPSSQISFLQYLMPFVGPRQLLSD